MRQQTKSLLEIYFAVFLFGFSGLFGKLIELPVPVIVFIRSFIALIVLALVIRLSKSKALRMGSAKKCLCLMLTGVVLAIYSNAFFYSIQISSVAIGLLSSATFPAFAVFIESLLLKEKLRTKNILIAFIALFGVFLIVPRIEISNEVTQGVLWGLVAGVAFALLSVLNRKYAQKRSSLAVAFYQNMGSAIVSLPAISLVNISHLTFNNIWLSVLLGVVFTAISHFLYIKGMTYIKARIATLIASLEPVFGILAAILVLGEIPAIRTIAGGAIVISTALIATKEGFKNKK